MTTSASIPDHTSASVAVPAALRGVVIGLDIGGTKTRGVRFEDGQPVADESAGSANVQNVSRDEAATNLAELFAKIGAGAVTRVYAGSGGIDTPEDAAALAGLIQPHVPEADVTVVHDSRLLLAAGRTTTGVAVIAGTGSAAWGRNSDGGEARAGGWGYLLGDEGSGYWLGREAVRYSLQRMNSGQPVDALTAALLTACQVDDPNRLIALFHDPAMGRRFWAQQARHVVAQAEQGHSASLAMVDQAGADLANLAAQVLRQLGLPGPVILGSGLGMNVPALQEAFRTHLGGQGITDVRILDQDPVFGVPHLLAEEA